MTEHQKTQRNPKDPMPQSGILPALGASCFVIPSCLSLSNFGLSPAFISPGGSEFLLIMLVLILLFGAKDAPRIFRTIQTTLDKIQRAAASFRYKIMYSDLHQETTGDTPYDVEAADPDDEDDLHWVDDDAEAEPEKQAAENPEDETEDAESKT
jgi:Sec-independent protein translocase protein TatA